MVLISAETGSFVLRREDLEEFGNNFSPYCVLEVRLVDRVIENGASCKGNYTSMRCTTNGRAVLRTRLPLETLV